MSVKRLMIAALLAVFSCGVRPASAATSVTMDGPMTDTNAQTGQAYPKQFNLNMDDHNIDYGLAQVVYSSGIYVKNTFVDGTASSATITVVNATALSTGAASGTLTIVSTTVAIGFQSTATVSIAGRQVGMNVSINGPPGGLNFVIGGNVSAADVTTNTAVNIMNAVNASSNTALITATLNTSSTTLTIQCINAGTACNSYTFLSSSTTAISTSPFTGGLNPVTVTIGGQAYQAVRDFAVGTSSAAMANNISALIVASSNTYLITSTAPLTCTNASSCGIIYATATYNGTAGNKIGLASSNSLAVSTSGVTFLGGTDNAQLCINGTCLTANKHWYPLATTAATADSLYAAINSSFTIVVATDTGSTAVIYTTSTGVGSGVNYTITSSSQPALKIGGAYTYMQPNATSTSTYIGGSTASYALNGQTLIISGHGWPVGLKVSISSTTGNAQLQYSTAAVGTATNLTWGSTWYLSIIDANTVGLSLTSTGAVAGLTGDVFLVSSKTLTTADVWQVNVATTAGSTAFGWYESNDGSNFWQVPGTATTTITTGDSFVYPSTFTFFDFGNIDAKWLQLNVSPPATAGAISISAKMHGEKR